MGKHHAKQLVLPVRSACISQVKIAHINWHKKHSCLERTVSTYLQQIGKIEFGIQNKAKPPFDLQPYSETIQPLRRSRTRRQTQLANPLRKRSHLLESWFASPLNTNHPHRKSLRSTASPFHFQVANPNDSLQGYSSGRKIQENSVPHSNDYLSVQLMHRSQLLNVKLLVHHVTSRL